MQKILINDNWQFMKINEAATIDQLPKTGYENVSLPHSWYKDDDQYRGMTVYRKEMKTESDWKKVFIEFCGADQNCKVYVNQTFIGEHSGAYSTFRFQIPDEAVASGTLTIEVLLDTCVNQTVSPIFGDFTVFGGLYRDVNLLVTDSEHFDYTYYGTDGVIIKAVMNENDGLVQIEPHVVTDKKDAMIRYEVMDQEGSVVAEAEKNASQNAEITVAAPHVWNGKDQTYLYTVKASLVCSGKVTDETTKTIGFRKIEMTADQGFYLNDQNIRLNGVSKHQDYANVFSAITEEHLNKDFEMIDDIGANAVRLSHYQHMQMTYDFCDRKGYVVWAEIPMLKMTENKELLENARLQLKELILQNIHHPSIFCWGIQNEIGMFKDVPYMHEECKNLTNITKELDETRLVTCANLYNVKHDSELNKITDMVGYNIYFGWYYGEMKDYSEFLDKLHVVNENLPVGISEYGVDASPFLHSEEPKVKDYSEEYQALYHETVYPIFNSKDYLWGSFVWNMFDFSSSRRNEGGVKYINQKGLVTFDREIKKDAYFYYKAVWSDQAFVHICSSRFVKRTSDEITVKIYTNLNEVELKYRDCTISGVNNGNGTVIFENVPLVDGSNTFAVEGISKDGVKVTDTVTFEKVSEPEESYKLPDADEGTTVKNWFLDDDTLVKEGFYSLEDSANDIMKCEEAFLVVKEFTPSIYEGLKNDVIPTGFSIMKMCNYDKEIAATVNLKEFNARLNQIKRLV